jgi:thioester reductase-like protein
MSTLLLTGFPGFLGSEILPRLLDNQPARQAICLVQSKFVALATRRVAELVKQHPRFEGRIHLVEGDITAVGLGLDHRAAPLDLKEVTKIFHLAAVYDLSVERDLAMLINLEGTRNVLDFAEECPNLQRFHYVSTCYVSGRSSGTFTEDDLAKDQVFNNFYEETKFLAEVEVQRRARQGLPTTVYRPSSVVGDSTTGATQKFDGPYFVIRWLLRQPSVAVLPLAGNARSVRINLVPQDYVVKAIAFLSELDADSPKIYQLADPNALTVDQLITEIGQALAKRIVRVPLPLRLAKGSLRNIPLLQKFIGIPPELLDYYTHPALYTEANTRLDLSGSGIELPMISRYLPRLVEFCRNHRDIGSGAMA